MNLITLLPFTHLGDRDRCGQTYAGGFYIYLCILCCKGVCMCVDMFVCRSVCTYFLCMDVVMLVWVSMSLCVQVGYVCFGMLFCDMK